MSSGPGGVDDPPVGGAVGGAVEEGAAKRILVGSRWHKVKAEMIRKRHLMIKIVEQTQARAALTPRVDGRIVCMGATQVGYL